MSEHLEPLVTIGVMAYNEEKHLADTLDSILKQSFDDYEIVVADNASEDSTGEIASRYAEMDSRIRHIRQPRNIGALQNYNSLVENARGKYFVLAGAHDLWSDNFLPSLFEVMEKRSDAVLAHGRTIWIDDDGAEMDRESGYIDTSDANIIARFNMTIWGNQHAMYGMYRLAALRRTRVQLEIIGSGAVMLGELVLLGHIIVVPEVTWYRRMNRTQETMGEKLTRYYRVLFSTPKNPLLPHWHIPWAYFTGILRAEISVTKKLLLTFCLINVFVHYRAPLLSDLRSVFARLFARVFKPVGSPSVR